MNVVIDTVYQVGLLFVMMIPGVLMKLCGLSTDGLGKGLSNLVLYIAQPALIFTAYLRPFDGEILINALWVLLLSVIAHVIFSVVSIFAFKKAPDMARRMLTFATVFSNAAFMGMPLVAAVLGSEALVYASIYNITFNLFLWSLGVFICTNKRDTDQNGVEDHIDRIKGGASPLKALYHPVTIAALLGLVFFILPIEGFVPKIISESFDMLKNLVAPLSMVVIGLRLPDIRLRGVFRDAYMYVFLALRHLILPLLVIGVIKLLALFGLSLNSELTAVVVILASAPAATSATMFAEKYSCDSPYVSRLVVISTILSIGTMPLMLLLL